MYTSYGIEYEYLGNSNYILKECINCTLVYQEEIPSAFLAKKIYDEWLDVETVSEFDDEKIRTEKSVRHSRQIERVIEYLGASPNELNFLDFGMGLGTWCRLARRFRCNVYGTDISEDRMGYVETSDIKVISYDDIPSYRFDFINSNQVLEHVAEPLEILLHLSQALKQRGVIKIAVPNGWDIKRRLEIWNLDKLAFSEKSENPFLEESDNSLNPVSPFEHINCFNYDALVMMAKRARLTPVSIPDRFSEQFSAKRKFKRLVRAIIRRYLYLLIGGQKEINGTNLFFAKLQ